MDEFKNIKTDDPINPSHYKDSLIECIDAIQSSMDDKSFMGYLKGNVLKYVWRFEKKNGVEDLEKARWYLNKLIEHLNKEFIND